MEGGIEKNLKDEYVRPLLANYIKFCTAYPEDAHVSVFLYRAAVLYYRAGNFGETIQLLEKILANYDSSPVLEDTYLTLAMIYNEKLMNEGRAKELYETYLKEFPKGYGIDEAEFYFMPEKEKIKVHIQRLNTQIENLPRGQEASESQYLSLIFAFAKFVELNPEDAISPYYCLNGAQYAIRVGYPIFALELLQKLLEEYPEYERYPEALYLKAEIYDSSLEDYLKDEKRKNGLINGIIDLERLEKIKPKVEAKKIYKNIIYRFPDAAISDQARNKLNLGDKDVNSIVNEMVRKQDSIQSLQ